MNAATQEQPRAGETYAESGESEFARLLQREVNPRDLLLDNDSFNKMVRIAEMMSSGKTTVPKHLQGNLGDCMAVVTQAMQWGMNPFAVAQKTHIVNGALGYEAQLVNAVLEATGAVRNHANYEYRGAGNDLECRVSFILAKDTTLTWNEWYRVGDVKVKNSPLWGTNPKQQLGYLQVKNWARQYAPGAILGIRTSDELQEIADAVPKGPQRKSGKGDAPPVERIDGDGVIHGAGETKQAETPKDKPAAAPAAPAAAGNPQGGITGNQVAYLRNKLKAVDVAEQKICDRFQVTSIELLNAEQFDLVKSELLAMS